MKKCFKCGAELSDDKNFCPYCGEPIANYNSTQSSKSTDTTIIKGDDTGRILGILSIAFSETVIVGLILGIIGLFKSETKKQKRLNQIGIGLSIGFAILIALFFIFYLWLIIGLFGAIGDGIQEGVNNSVQEMVSVLNIIK